jgi:RecA-family ATPase
VNIVIKRASELQAKTSEWLIEDIIPERSLCFLSAAPKLGKTMVALELATALTSGKPAFGKYKVMRKGKALYFAGEDAEGGFKKRIDGFAKAKGVDVNGLELYTVTEQKLLVDTPEGRAELERMLDYVKPDLLVLDNLSRIHHSNENNAILMGEIFEYLQHIKIKYGISILLVHHMGKDGTLRGSSQIDSYYEAALFLKLRNEQRVIDFKFRNYEERIGVPYAVNSNNGNLSVELGEVQVKEETAKVIPMKQVSSNPTTYAVDDTRPKLIPIKGSRIIQF